MASRAYSGIHTDGDDSLMDESKTNPNSSAHAPCSPTSFHKKDPESYVRFRDSGSRRILQGLARGSLLFASMMWTGCGDEPAERSAVDTPAKPAEPTVPEDIQAAAQSLLGKETQVLVFGDLARTGKQQFLAANVVPKTPKNDLPGTIVTRAVIAEETDGKWSELFRCDEHLKNAKGFLALTPLSSVAGWKVQYEQDPVKGIQLYFTPILGSPTAPDKHVLPIGVAWNPATKRYQSLDRTYEHFLMEAASLETARSVLR
jgi:hypothetical protein